MDEVMAYEAITSSIQFHALTFLRIPLKTRDIYPQFRQYIIATILHKRNPLVILIENLDVDAQALQLFDQYFERLWHTRLYHGLSFHNGLIGLDAPRDIVGFHSQNLLQGIGCSIRIHGPDLHFAETLSAKLRSPPQRLLRDHAVGAGGAGVYFVINHMRQFQHIGIADRDGMIKRLARPSIIELHFPTLRQPGATQKFDDIIFCSAIEGGSRDLHAQYTGCPAQMRLHNLPQVHAPRHSQRGQNNINGCAIRQEGHVLYWQDPRDDALIAVATSHLITYANLMSLRHTHPYGTVYTRRQFVPGVAREYLYVDDFTLLAVWHAQRVIFDLTRLLTKDGSQELLFGR